MLIFTGERQNSRHEVLLGTRRLHLTPALLAALVQLVLARGTTETGFLPLGRLTVSRLRRAVDAATAPGSGAHWIETGVGQEYRLTIPAKELAERVAVTEEFLRLARERFLSEDETQRLQACCSVWKPDGYRNDTGMIPDGN